MGKTVIFGGAGFLGKKLAERLLAHGETKHLILFDTVEPQSPLSSDPRVQVVTGDINDRALLRRLFTQDITSIFHLAAVVSAAAESDFDLGMRVNVYGTLEVLEACRLLRAPPRLVFTSSIAVYGGDLPDVVDDSVPLTPQSSYGTQKAIGELLVADYTRKGFIDGRAVRLPTIVVRPGKPNKAASGFASSIIREPLQGSRVVCPVTEEARLAILSPGKAIDGLVRAHEISAEAVAPSRRFNIPGLSVTVGEMVAALKNAAGSQAVERIDWKPDPSIQRLVDTWPRHVTSQRACQLGFTADGGIDEIIRAFIEEELPVRS